MANREPERELRATVCGSSCPYRWQHWQIAHRLKASSSIVVRIANQRRKLNGRRKLVHEDSNTFWFLMNKYSLKCHHYHHRQGNQTDYQTLMESNI
jgi:hypothetical protein